MKRWAFVSFAIWSLSILGCGGDSSRHGATTAGSTTAGVTTGGTSSATTGGLPESTTSGTTTGGTTGAGTTTGGTGAGTTTGGATTGANTTGTTTTGTTTTGGGIGGTSGGTSASPYPTIGGCQIFPSNNPWNTDISQYPVNPNWTSKYLANMHTGTSLHPDWGPTMNPGPNPDPPYGIPYNVVPQNQPLVAISFTTDPDYAGQSDPGPYPIPANPKIESPTDSHMLILQQGVCALYETWQTTQESNGSWYANNGAKFDLTSNTLRPDGETSGDAAGLPILPGLVRYDEVAAGAIHHAVRFTMNNTYNGYIHPATHAAGLSSDSYPPMGLRLRLNSSVDISGYSKEAQVILQAMKTYGIILADNGSNWYVQGDTNDGWTSSVMSGIIDAFNDITGADFTAVDTGPVLTTGL